MTKLNKGVQLAMEVLYWWETHQYDVWDDGEDEHNCYDIEPTFITLAKKLMKKE